MAMEFNQREWLNLSMGEYISKFCPLTVPGLIEDFRSMRVKLLWTVHCRSDISWTIAKLNQITEKDFDQYSDVQLTRRNCKALAETFYSISIPENGSQNASFTNICRV